MANIRQYIGARYVIKIYENSQDASSAEWEQGNFEPLIMVTWQNGSYLSKKDVPASVGNPADNPTYWVQTGFYNGQIAALQQQIDTINAAIEALQDRQERIVLVGDSYDAMGGNFFDVVISLLPYINIEKTSLGGVSFANAVSSDPTRMSYKTLLENANITDPESVTRIIIVGGYNEVNHPDDIENGVIATVEYIKTTFPNASIEFMPVGNDTLTDINKSIFQCEDRAAAKLMSLGGVVYNNAKYILSNVALKNADNVHPNASGKSELVKYLIDVIISHKVDIYREKDIAIASPTGVNFSLEGNGVFIQHNGVCTLEFPKLTCRGASGTNGTFAIAAHSDAVFISMTGLSLRGKCNASHYPYQRTGLILTPYMGAAGILCYNITNDIVPMGCDTADITSGTLVTNMVFMPKFIMNLHDGNYSLTV